MEYNLQTPEQIAFAIGQIFNKYGKRTSHLYLFKMICLELKLDMKKESVTEEEIKERIDY